MFIVTEIYYFVAKAKSHWSKTKKISKVAITVVSYAIGRTESEIVLILV